MNHVAKRTVTALATATAVVAAFCYLPLSVVAPVLIIVGSLVQTEFLQMASRKYGVGVQPGVAAGIVYLATKVYGGWDTLVPVVFALALWTLFKKGDKPIERLAVTLLSFFYVPFMIGFFLDVARVEVMLLFSLLALTKISDMGGFAFGLAFGKHKMCPSVSPKKSWEGMAGSIFGSCLIATLFWYLAGQCALPRLAFWKNFSLCQMLLIGSSIAVFGTLGDLVESRFKRECEVKDSATFMPAGMGGFLDMFDSILFIPALFAVLFMR
jgi:phosphatidate cytidylyltransferase